jgi:hypothetical protein
MTKIYFFQLAVAIKHKFEKEITYFLAILKLMPIFLGLSNNLATDISLIIQMFNTFKALQL